jgi:hypothetical protein
VGTTYFTHGGGERLLQGSDWEAEKIRAQWEDLDVGGLITLRWILLRYGSIGRIRFGWIRVGSSGGLC